MDIRYGKLTVLDSKIKTKHKYYYCKCDCGNKKWIRADMITNGSIVSCGCYNKEKNLYKPNDITNERFGKLVAVAPTKERDKNNGSVVWKCKCDCGELCYVAASELEHKKVKSCGCLITEKSKENIKKAVKKHLEEHIVEGTNISAISRKKLQSNNTSGTTGVIWDKNRKKWVAQIAFKGKHYSLGRYENKEDAVKVRKEAEKKIFGEFLEWYHKTKGDNRHE